MRLYFLSSWHNPLLKITSINGMLSVTVRAMGTINSSGYRAAMVKESHVGIIHEYKSCAINVHLAITT